MALRNMLISCMGGSAEGAYHIHCPPDNSIGVDDDRNPPITPVWMRLLATEPIDN